MTRKPAKIFWIRKTVSKPLVLSALLLFASIPAAVRADTPSCAVAEASLGAASGIRGLTPKKKVVCHLHSKDKIRGFILSTIDTKVPAERMRMEELVFKAIGFIPKDFDYKKGLIELYVSQIGGYYDPEKDHYIMADWMPDLLQTPVAVHELTHALQDQYYDLEKLIDMNLGNSDELLARSALVEGDATAVMHDYTRGLAGLPPLKSEAVIDSLLMQNVLSLGFSTGDGIPDSLKLYLLFPYTSGLRFAHTLLQKEGYTAIDDAFRTPPRSTEEVLHPEKYGKGDFVLPPPQEVVSSGCPKELPVLYSDTLGEFAISILLSSATKRKADAAEAAKGWGGDIVVVRDKGEGARCLVWETRWDSEGDAEEFWRGMVLKLRESSTQLRDEGGKVELENTSLLRIGPKTILFAAELEKEASDRSSRQGDDH